MSHAIDLEGENQKFHAFVNLAFFMAAITGIELVVIFIPFSYGVVMAAIVVLSVVKFFGVILWFMHLVYDKLFCTILFLMGLCVALGTVTALLLLFNSDRTLPLEEASLSSPPQSERLTI